MKTKERVLLRENGAKVYGLEITGTRWSEEKAIRGASFRGFVADEYRRVYSWIRKIDENFFVEVKQNGILH